MNRTAEINKMETLFLTRPHLTQRPLISALLLALAMIATSGHWASATPIYSVQLADQSDIGRGLGPLATVQLVSNNTLTGYSAVDVTVSPYDTATTGFVTTGVHHAFSFNIATAVTFLNLTNGFVIGTGGASNPPWGNFTYNIDCTICGNGSTNPQKGPLTFTLRASTAAAISPTTFSANALGSFFAADLSLNGSTGAAGTSRAPTITGMTFGGGQTANVPEPATMVIMTLPIALLAIRRRRERA